MMKKFKDLTPEHQQVIIDIQKSVPKEWVDAVIKKEDIAPVSKEIMERAIVDPEVDEKTKAEFRAVLNSGFFDKKVDVEDDLVGQLIDAYVEKEILKAVIKKQLPKLKKRQDYGKVYKRFNQLKLKYDSRTTS